MKQACQARGSKKKVKKTPRAKGTHNLAADTSDSTDEAEEDHFNQVYVMKRQREEPIYTKLLVKGQPIRM